MYISSTDKTAANRAPALLTLDNTSGTQKATIFIPGIATGFQISITVTGTITDNGTWLSIPVTFDTGGMPTNNDDRYVYGIRNGDTGNDGSFTGRWTFSSATTAPLEPPLGKFIANTTTDPTDLSISYQGTKDFTSLIAYIAGLQSAGYSPLLTIEEVGGPAVYYASVSSSAYQTSGTNVPYLDLVLSAPAGTSITLVNNTVYSISAGYIPPTGYTGSAGGGASTVPVSYTFGGYGTPSTGTNKTPWLRASIGSTCVSASLVAKTAPVIGPFAVQILRSSDGGSTFPTTAAYINLPANSNVATTSVSTVLTTGDLLRFDILSVNTASDWTCQLYTTI